MCTHDVRRGKGVGILLILEIIIPIWQNFLFYYFDLRTVVILILYWMIRHMYSISYARGAEVADRSPSQQQARFFFFFHACRGVLPYSPTPQKETMALSGGPSVDWILGGDAAPDEDLEPWQRVMRENAKKAKTERFIELLRVSPLLPSPTPAHHPLQLCSSSLPIAREHLSHVPCFSQPFSRAHPRMHAPTHPRTRRRGYWVRTSSPTWLG